MKLIHFTPIRNLEKYMSRGIPVTRRRNRIQGVFAAPMLDFSPTVICNWRRILQQERKIVHGAIVFEIPDQELVYFSPDWTHHMLGERNLITAKAAEAETFELGREKLEPLSATQRESYLKYMGSIFAYDQPCYDFSLVEIVIPRRIEPEEILYSHDYRKVKKSKRLKVNWLDLYRQEVAA